MTDKNRVQMDPDTGEVVATLTPTMYRNWCDFFDIELLLIRGAGEKTDDGRRVFRFVMPDDGRREVLKRFLQHCQMHMAIEQSLN